MVSVDEMKLCHLTIFDGMALEGRKDVYIDPKSGWAEASSALKLIIETALSEGVEAIQATVKNLTLDCLENCTGVHTEDGRALRASHTILATGAETIGLLADGTLGHRGFRSENRLFGAGVVSTLVELD